MGVRDCLGTLKKEAEGLMATFDLADQVMTGSSKRKATKVILGGTIVYLATRLDGHPSEEITKDTRRETTVIKVKGGNN